MPFLALRSYLPADHPDKGREIGSEPTPAAFIDRLLELTVEWRRLLAPHGSICIELGDTYAGSGGAGGDYDTGLRDGQAKFNGSALKDRNDGNRMQQGRGWPLDKSLCLIPELYRTALVYGLNPLTGQPSPAGTWRARNVIRWCRPNPPVGALGDKVRPATSDMVVACVSGKRYFDLDAIRRPASREGWTTRDPRMRGDVEFGEPHETERVPIPASAPPLDHWWHNDLFEQDAWLIPTAPYKGSHYATWPPELCVTPIRAMCPERVCVTCGEPSRRITEKSAEHARKGRGWADESTGRTKAAGRERNGHSAQPPGDHIAAAEYVTLGWSDCGHDNNRPGLVLDPFAGSGTTLAVATGLGRHAVGIDLDSRNADLARERVGMFLEVEYGEAVA